MPKTDVKKQLTTEEARRVEEIGRTVESIRSELRKKIVGLDAVIDQLLTALFAGGHTLIVGVPGLAKTLLIRSLAQILGLDFSRIQFTPDLMPSDITGTELITQNKETGQRTFEFAPGPIFANLILADEINRTPPKTQAALMEAMEERQVTSGGKKHTLDRPFYVLATQNPIEQEGTYPLPVAQLDRFMFQIQVDYPTADEEYEIATLTTSGYQAELEPLLNKGEILDLLGLVRKIRISDENLRYAMTLGRFTRPDDDEGPAFVNEWLEWGSGPRAAQSLILGAKARAMTRGRTEVQAADIRAVARPALRHRIILNYHAEAESVEPDDVIDDLIEKVPAPDGWTPADPEWRAYRLARKRRFEELAAGHIAPVKGGPIGRSLRAAHRVVWLVGLFALLSAGVIWTTHTYLERAALGTGTGLLIIDGLLALVGVFLLGPTARLLLAHLRGGEPGNFVDVGMETFGRLLGAAAICLAITTPLWGALFYVGKGLSTSALTTFTPLPITVGFGLTAVWLQLVAFAVVRKHEMETPLLPAVREGGQLLLRLIGPTLFLLLLAGFGASGGYALWTRSGGSPLLLVLEAIAGGYVGLLVHSLILSLAAEEAEE